MKKILSLLFTAALLLCSCKKMDIDGGLSFHMVYILIGDLEVPAHNYTLTIPAEEGEYTIPLLTSGLWQSKILSQCEGVEVAADIHKDTVIGTEEWNGEHYPITGIPDEYAYKWGYKENIRISAAANPGRKARKLKFRVMTMTENAADITVRQEGR